MGTRMSISVHTMSFQSRGISHSFTISSLNIKTHGISLFGVLFDARSNQQEYVRSIYEDKHRKSRFDGNGRGLSTSPKVSVVQHLAWTLQRASAVSSRQQRHRGLTDMTWYS